MKNYERILELCEEILGADESLKTKWVKAESARQRKRINEVQKLSVKAKRELIAEDEK